MNFSLFTLIFLLGAVQGLILALSLFFSRNDKRQAKYFLGALILVLSYDMFETAMWLQQIKLISTRIFTYSLLFTLGASFYLTIKASIDSEKLPAKKVLLLYSPAIVDFFVSLAIFFIDIFEITDHQTLMSIYDAHVVSSRLLMVIVFWIYFGYTVREFQRFVAASGSEISAPESETGIITKWLRSFLGICFLLAVVWTLTIFGVVFFDRQQVMQLYYPLEFLLAVLIYWIGFTGYHRIKIVHLGEQKKSRVYFDKLSTDEISSAVEALSQAMLRDKMFLDPELNLAKLAAYLNLPPKTLSSVLNQHLNLGFNEYVNGFRIEEVKRNLLRRDANSTVLSVALDSGFNSLATFQRVFKNLTGITPKQFLAENRQKTHNF